MNADIRMDRFFGQMDAEQNRHYYSSYFYILSFLNNQKTGRNYRNRRKMTPRILFNETEMPDMYLLDAVDEKELVSLAETLRRRYALSRKIKVCMNKEKTE